MTIPKTKLVLLTVLGLFFTSCGDMFDTYGCRDNNALNYNPKADISDESCVYEAKGVVYWSSDTEQYFATHSITHVSVQLGEEVLVDKAAVSDYQGTGANPGCYSPEWIPYDIRLFQNSYGTKFIMRDQNDSLFYSDVIYPNIGCSEIYIDL